ncbi:hypothetical protein BGZ73_001627 [Actinomortierella ambigua]|nr:hypothetical protein BGZ73_001627 [Actinomortierella ambigua]
MSAPGSGPIVPNVSGTTLEESGEIVDPSTVIEGAHSQSDQAELRPLDIIAPVILLGVTQDFDASSAAVPNEAEEATLPWKPEESKSELALPLPLSTLSADIYAQRGDGESERSGSAQSNKNDDDPSQGLQPCPHSPTEWDEDLTELRSSSSGPTSGRPSTGFYTVAGFVTVLFVASQAALIGLLTMLFLGVLILTEFVLDREDESPDASRRCRLYWARGVGISIATIASAIHGSMLSTYVLLDGQSDWISKAVIASIAFYWPAMIVLMKHISVPPPWEC